MICEECKQESKSIFREPSFKTNSKEQNDNPEIFRCSTCHDKFIKRNMILAFQNCININKNKQEKV